MPRPSLHEACSKIVATVGPASDSVEMLAKLIEAGVDVFRVNTAHGDQASFARVLENIRVAARQVGYAPAVLLDLAGPKIRLGEVPGQALRLRTGNEVTFVRGDAADEGELTSNYERLIDELDPGDRVLLADGTVSLKVESVTADRARCRVTAGGTVRSRQGINLPGVKLSVDSMLDVDIANAIWAAENEIDLVSLSFVRKPDDVAALKRLLAEHGSSALVIAKIEKPEALARLEEIVDEADGIMVARGDLGVEIDVAETPIAQKRIIRVCRNKVKPVIVATQMLESMHTASRPTRAEVSDVANAILDGTDACMLSGETAIGDDPVRVVETMHRIMTATEREMVSYDSHGRSHTRRVHPITTAVTESATQIAEKIDAKLIVIATRSGNTAWIKSQSRSLIPTIGATESDATLRRMNLLWGIKPLRIERIGHSLGLIDQIDYWATKNGDLSPGDKIVLVAGTGVVENAHNLVLVHALSATTEP